MINNTKVVNIKKQKCDVYIGRGSKWGNPYTHLKTQTLAEFKVDTREESIERYKEYVLNNKYLLSCLNELYGQKLGCYCKPLPCHGDILVELVKDRFGNEI